MKKVIRVFALPSHQTKERTSGVDMVRVIQPISHLNGYEDKDVKFETTVWTIENPLKINWLDVAQQYDIIFLNYIANPWTFAGMGAMARRFNRKIVMDTDDDLNSLMPDNPAYEAYKKGGENIRNLTAIYNEVDYITTTNQHLKNVLLTHTFKRNEQIRIFPNYIDLDTLYTHRSPFKDTLNIQLFYFGSTTHFLDLDEEEFMKGIDRIFKDYPNVTFKTIGAFMPKYQMRWGQRYSHSWGDSDIYKWIKDKMPKFMDEMDIMVVPLKDSTYTRSKSCIKFLEASSYKKPGVWVDMRQYREVVDGYNGLLAKTEDEWYNQIKKLLDDPKLRKQMGENAFKTVKKDWQMKDHVRDYASFFKEILL